MRALHPLVLFGLLLLPSCLQAQGVTGRLQTSSGDAVEAAFVVLLDSAGERVRSTLSDPAGRYLLRATQPGRYRLRIERLGLATQTSELLTLSATTTLAHDVVLVEKPVVLEGIVARSEGRACRTPRQLAADGALLWEEARKALSVAAWASESRRTPMLIERALREEEGRGRVVVQEADTIVRDVSGSPWQSAPAHELARVGFVRRHGDGYLYYGADAHLLLDDVFLRGHCFRPVDHPEDEAQVGLQFTPRDDPRVTDIEGVLWFGRDDLTLRSLEFRYVKLPYRARDTVGGSVTFRRMPTGLWVVSEWRIRTPRPHFSGIRGELLQSELRLSMLDALDPDGRSIFTGSVVDLTPYRAQRDLPMAEGQMSARIWAAQHCGGSARPGFRHAVGYVSAEGMPLQGATVRLTIFVAPQKIAEDHRQTDAAGLYRFCNVPADFSTGVTVSMEGYESQEVEMGRKFDTFLHTDFALLRATSRGSR